MAVSYKVIKCENSQESYLVKQNLAKQDLTGVSLVTNPPTGELIIEGSVHNPIRIGSCKCALVNLRDNVYTVVILEQELLPFDPRKYLSVATGFLVGGVQGAMVGGFLSHFFS